MVTVREPNYMFEHEIEPEIDWDNLAEDEVEAAVQKLSDYGDQDKFTYKRYQELIPSFVNSFLESRIQSVNNTKDSISKSEAIAFMSFLEFDFEVDMDGLEKTATNTGVVKFSTGNFPFGGLDRFIIALKAYDLVATECFNGFSVIEVNWTSNFEFNVTELPEETKIYLKK